MWINALAHYHSDEGVLRAKRWPESLLVQVGYLFVLLCGSGRRTWVAMRDWFTSAGKKAAKFIFHRAGLEVRRRSNFAQLGSTELLSAKIEELSNIVKEYQFKLERQPDYQTLAVHQILGSYGRCRARILKTI